MAQNTCSIDGCEKPVKSRGWCSAHWTRWSRYGDPNIVKTSKRPKGMSPYEWAMENSVVVASGCREFQGRRTGGGYGQIGHNGRSLYAHRVVMEHHHGRSELNVLHSCDNPCCVEITHLRYGTQAENVLDALGRGRMHQRLTVEQVLAIRADTRTKTAIAAEYGITRSHVLAVKERRTWKHI